MHLSPAGALAQEIWDGLPDRFRGVRLDTRVVMPNHVHGVIWITEGGPPLSGVIGGYKSLVAKAYGVRVEEGSWRPYSERFWQHSFHERVVRNEEELTRIREYVVQNPVRWEAGPEFIR